MAMVEFLASILKRKEPLKGVQIEEDYRLVLTDHTVRINNLEKMVAKLLGAKGGRPPKQDNQPDTEVIAENDKYKILKSGKYVIK
jgi:hypothetical protein